MLRGNTTARTHRLATLLQHEYSRRVYGSYYQVDMASLRVVWLELLPAEALRHIGSAEIGLCALTTGRTHGVEDGWRGCISQQEAGCLSACARGVPAALADAPLLYTPHAWPGGIEPRGAAWVRASMQVHTPVRSHAWVEVTHCGLPRFESTSPWFFVAPGSGVSLNVGRTVVLDERAALAAGASANKWNLSNEMEQLRKRPRGLLARYLGLGPDAAAGVDTVPPWALESEPAPLASSPPPLPRPDAFASRHQVQRLHHREAMCTERRQELLLLGLAAPLAASAPLLSPALLKSGLLKCGKWPTLFACRPDTPAIRFMAACTSVLSPSVRARVGRCSPPPAPPPPAVACAPAVEHDTPFEACYSWCPQNWASNCPRCKCRACPQCRAPAPPAPPSPPPPPMPPPPTPTPPLFAATISATISAEREAPALAVTPTWPEAVATPTSEQPVKDEAPGEAPAAEAADPGGDLLVFGLAVTSGCLLTRAIVDLMRWCLSASGGRNARRLSGRPAARRRLIASAAHLQAAERFKLPRSVTQR